MDHNLHEIGSVEVTAMRKMSVVTRESPSSTLFRLSRNYGGISFPSRERILRGRVYNDNSQVLLMNYHW